MTFMQHLHNVSTLCQGVNMRLSQRATAIYWTGLPIWISQSRIHVGSPGGKCHYACSSLRPAAISKSNCFNFSGVSVSDHILKPCSVYSRHRNYAPYSSSTESGPGIEPSSNPSSKTKTKPTILDHHSIVGSLKKLENAMRFHGYSTLKIGIGLVIVIGVVVYLLRDPIRDNVAEEVSQVASRSLEHEHVVGKAEEFAKSLLHTILHDENMLRLASEFVKQVLDSPETRKASVEYVSNILQDPQTRQLLAATIKEVLLIAIHDPDTTAALKAVVVLILSDPESQRSARELIAAVFRHEDLKAVASTFFSDVMNSQQVVNQATQLGKEVTYRIVTDPNLTEQTGKSLWQAVKYSVTPSWFAKSLESSVSPSAQGKPELEEMPSVESPSEIQKDQHEPESAPKLSPESSRQKPTPESPMPQPENDTSGDIINTGQDKPDEEVMEEEQNIMT